MARFLWMTCILLLWGNEKWTRGEVTFSAIKPIKDLVQTEAVKFIELHRNPFTREWPEGETAAGLLGLMANDPFLYDDAGEFVRQMDLKNLAVDFLIMMNRLNKRDPVLHSNQDLLGRVDDATFLEYMGAIHGLCGNPANFEGFDLLKEAKRRALSFSSGRHRGGGLFGGMSLALCNAGVQIPRSVLDTLTDVDLMKVSSGGEEGILFRAEKASLDLLAIICVVQRRKEQGYLSTRLTNITLPNLVRVIVDSVQHPNGTFRAGFMPTALALQALNRVHNLNGIIGSGKIDLNAMTLHLMSMRNEKDGSFGESLAFTSLAVPALSGQTAADFRKIHCHPQSWEVPHPPHLPHKVSYLFVDRTISKQQTKGHFFTTHNVSVFDAFKSFSLRGNRPVLDIELEKTPFGTLVKRVNELGRYGLGEWKTLRAFSNGNIRDITQFLDVEKVLGDSRFIFIFRPKV